MPQKMDLWYSRLAQILMGDPRRLGDFAISFLMIPNPHYSNFKSTEVFPGTYIPLLSVK